MVDTLRFIDIKKKEIDPFFEDYKKFEIFENAESTSKKLIYQVPFSRQAIMGEMLLKLEKQFSDRAYVDVEINSLEDAYINIAKEEEKLLFELQRDGMKRFSQKDIG